ncbi:MAG: hypothetical protein MJ113_04370 [Lachnospiraceae bacterium]|nr:hypothetical protein [Lachnospiraceae bacterium]
MSGSKKTFATFLCGLMFLFIFAGCDGNSEDNKQSLTGNAFVSAEKTEMLDLSSLNDTKEKVYKTRQVTLGNYEVTSSQKATIVYENKINMTLRTDYDGICFEGFVIDTYQYVKQGTVIGYYRETVNEDTKTNLNFDYELAKHKGDEKRIREIEEKFAEFDSAWKKKEILAPCDGIMISTEKIRQGSYLGSGSKICTFASLENCLLSVENSYGYYRYGQEVDIEANVDGSTFKTKGYVITASKKGISSNLRNNVSFIRVKDEDAKLFTGSGIMVNTKAVLIENVPLIEAGLVKSENGVSYVLIMKDGIVSKRRIIIGKQNSTYVWVADGLSEGEIICYD